MDHRESERRRRGGLRGTQYGDARTADVVLSAKGAESVTVAISQKAVFSSDLVGRYTPYVPDPENPIANFFINPVYADMDSEKVPQIDMGFLLGVPGYTCPLPPSPVWPTSSWG